MVASIRLQASGEETFDMEIPSDSSLQGIVRFYHVRSIENGFLVPDTALRTICDLDTTEQWRG